MPNRYFINGGVNNNWGSTTNWSTSSGGSGGASVPTSSDSAFFDSNSPNCTIDTTTRQCQFLDCTGYANTLSFSRGLTVSNGITFSNSMGITGSNILFLNGNSKIESNGKVIPIQVSLGGNINCELPSRLNISTTFSFLPSSQISFTGSFGWSASILSIQTVGLTHSLKAGVTYSVSSAILNLSSNNSQRTGIVSDESGTYSKLLLSSSATQKLGYMNISWIDASSGQSLYTFNGTLDNTVNCLSLDYQIMGIKYYPSTIIAI